MHLRRFTLPHTLGDVCGFLLLFTFIPITFVFELTIVLLDFHNSGSFFYNFTWIAGLFVVFNLTGNLLACMFVDTSIKCEILSPPTSTALRKNWRYCDDCEVLAPPRSWHCQTCRTCILKRDHHCLFTGCCVGHRNHRYFVLFLFYLFIGSAYTTAYNSIYFWVLHRDTYANITTITKLVFPMIMLVKDVSWNNFYLLIYELNIVALLFSLLLIVYHLPSVLKGSVSYEKNSLPKYNLGLWRNLEMVMGKRMHLVWLSPFIRSELPHDGIHWDTVTSQIAKFR